MLRGAGSTGGAPAESEHPPLILSPRWGERWTTSSRARRRPQSPRNEDAHRCGGRIATDCCVALLLATVIVAVVVRHVVYPALSWNRDEATYLWQVRALREGQLMTTTGGLPQFFQPWLTGVHDGHFFSQYTLGWPAVMLVADVFGGSPAASIVFGTTLAVLGTFVFVNEVTRDRVLALVSATLLLASPMVITQSGVYLSYLFTLGVGLLFGAALLAGLRRQSRWLLVAAGALLGVAFVTRPYDAVLWAVAIGGYTVFTTWREWRRQGVALALVTLGFLPFLVLQLVQNRIVTGSFTQFPFSAKEPLDAFGFGFRRLLPDVPGVDYTIKEAIRGVTTSGRSVPEFLVGSYVGVVLTGVGLWLRRRDRTTFLWLGLIVVFPAGYFVFWGSRLASHFAFLSGPVYLVPLFVPLCVFVATALSRCGAAGHGADRHPGRARDRRHAVPVRQGRDEPPAQRRAGNPGVTRPDALPGRSLVVVRDSGSYLLHLNPFSSNTPTSTVASCTPSTGDRARSSCSTASPAGRHTWNAPTPPARRHAARASRRQGPDHHAAPDQGGQRACRHARRRRARPDARSRRRRDPRSSGHRRLERRILQPSAASPDVYRTTWTLVPRNGAPGAASVAADTVSLAGRGRFSVTAAAAPSVAQAPTVRQLRTQYRVPDPRRCRRGARAGPRKSVVIPVAGGTVVHDVGSLSRLGVHVSG